MERTELTELVKKHIGEYFERDASFLKPESRIATAFDGVDSLKLFEMVVYLEECFEINFDESVLESLDTLKNLVDYIEGKLKEKA